MAPDNERMHVTMVMSSDQVRWLISNVYNKRASAFFQEIFQQDTDGKWQRVAGYAIRDTENRDKWNFIFVDSEHQQIRMPRLPEPVEPENLAKFSVIDYANSQAPSTLGRLFPALATRLTEWRLRKARESS